MCLLIFCACKDMIWLTLKIAHAIYGQIGPNPQKGPFYGSGYFLGAPASCAWQFRGCEEWAANNLGAGSMLEKSLNILEGARRLQKQFREHLELIQGAGR